MTFAGHRAADEQDSEFLASTDSWFRPVQVRTGPDGGIWVVDMYRFVIEHPRWISPDRLAMLDVRAGADKGRIYRSFPRQPAVAAGAEARHAVRPRDLAAALDNPNGTLRDTVQRLLVDRADLRRGSHPREPGPDQLPTGGPRPGDLHACKALGRARALALAARACTIRTPASADRRSVLLGALARQGRRAWPCGDSAWPAIPTPRFDTRSR